MNVTDDKQEKQVVSKQRVADHGEVYTAKREGKRDARLGEGRDGAY